MSADEKTAGSRRELNEKPITGSATPPGAVLDPKPLDPRPRKPVHRGPGLGFALPGLFRTATHAFTVDSTEILDTRSLHNDSDKASVTVAVGDQPAQTLTKDLGDVDNGTHPINLEVGPVAVSDPQVGIAFNYLIANAGHADWNTIDGVLKKAGNALAQKVTVPRVSVGGAGGTRYGLLGLHLRPGWRLRSLHRSRDRDRRGGGERPDRPADGRPRRIDHVYAPANPPAPPRHRKVLAARSHHRDRGLEEPIDMIIARRIPTSILVAPAVAIALLLSAPAPPSSAKTFDFNSNGSMILQPLPPEFACALERAARNQQIPCHRTHGPHRESRAPERLTPLQAAYELIGKAKAHNAAP